MSDQQKDPDLRTVRVATTEQLLGAGYVPEGRNLRGKDGSLLESSFLGSYAGKAVAGRVTESKDYPVTVDGYVLPAAAVAIEVSSDKLKGVDHTVFADGSLSVGSTHYSVRDTAKLVGLLNTGTGRRGK